MHTYTVDREDMLDNIEAMLDTAKDSGVTSNRITVERVEEALEQVPGVTYDATGIYTIQADKNRIPGRLAAISYAIMDAITLLDN